MGLFLPLLVVLLGVLLVRFDHEKGFERRGAYPLESAVDETDDYIRNTIWFPSHGTNCEGWLFTPKYKIDGENAGAKYSKPPLVIMAHGIGGQKDMGLSQYARAFVKEVCRPLPYAWGNVPVIGVKLEGIAVLVFDYRNFGGSDGEPRNWVSPKRHLQDWEAALQFAWGSMGNLVDASRIAIWGSSFGGGHVIVTAAGPGKNVSCVVSQIPHLDGRIAMKAARKIRGPVIMLQVLFAAVRDLLRKTLGMGRVYIPLAAVKPTPGAMTLTDEQLQTYYSKHPKVYIGGWKNGIPASLLFEVPFYNPVDYLPNVTAPILMLVAGNDTVCPEEALDKARANAPPQMILKSWPTDHFKFYKKPVVDEAISEMVAFLKGCLKP